MATQPNVTEEVKTNQPEVDEATGKFIYMYQPRDSEGQFIGKPYKYLYTDNADLIRQITEGKEQGDRFIHEVKTGKRKLQGEAAAPARVPARSREHGRSREEAPGRVSQDCRAGIGSAGRYRAPGPRRSAEAQGRFCGLQLGIE